MIKILIFIGLIFSASISLATEAGLCLSCQNTCLPEISIDLNPKTICKISQVAINNLKKELTEAILEEGNIDDQTFTNIPFPRFHPETGDIILSKKSKVNIQLKETKIQDIEIEIKSTKCDNNQIEVSVILNRLKATTKIHAKDENNKELFDGIEASLGTSKGDQPSEFFFKAKIDSEKGLGDFINIDETSGKSNLKAKRIKVYLNDGDQFLQNLSEGFKNQEEEILKLAPSCPQDSTRELARAQYLRLKTFLNAPETCQTEKQIQALNKIKDHPEKLMEVLISSDLYHHPKVSQILNQGLDKIAQKNGFKNRGNLTSLMNLQFLANELSKNEEFVDFLNPFTTEILQPIAQATNRGLKNLPSAISKGLQQVPAFNLNSGAVDGNVSYDELIAILQQGSRGAMMNLYQKKECAKSTLKVDPKNNQSDFSVNFSLKAIESYFEKIKSKGFLKICTGSNDEVNCSGGRWLEVKETPQLRFENGKLKMKLKHLVSVGDFETDFDLSLEKCKDSYCFKLKNPNTEVKSTGIMGFILKTFKINNIVDAGFSEKFDIVNEKSSATALPVQIVNAAIDTQNQRVEIEFNLKD